MEKNDGFNTNFFLSVSSLNKRCRLSMKTQKFDSVTVQTSPSVEWQEAKAFSFLCS